MLLSESDHDVLIIHGRIQLSEGQLTPMQESIDERASEFLDSMIVGDEPPAESLADSASSQDHPDELGQPRMADEARETGNANLAPLEKD